MPMNSQPRVLAVGEVLWDVFPDGPRFGGAPANLACHAHQLGCQVSILSRVGRDDLGQRAREFLQRLGVDTRYLQEDGHHPTGRVNIELSSEGAPTFEIIQEVAWDYLTWEDDWITLAAEANAICFGTLGQRHRIARGAIQRLLSVGGEQQLRMLDLNLRRPFDTPDIIESSLHQANALKLNEDELKVLSKQFSCSGSDLEQLQQLQARFGLRLLALTRGAAGSLLVTPTEHHQQAGADIKVVDTVGAGDSYTATVVTGYLRGYSLEVIHPWASRVAAFVCGQSGAVPTLPDELRQAPAR